MSIMSDCDAWQVEQNAYTVAGVETAVYCPRKLDNAKPNVLIMHGLNGSWRGVKLLGFLLRRQYNVYFVDLPGHGASSTPHFGLEGWGAWAKELIQNGAIAGGSSRIDYVVAHSFGCYVASMIKTYHDIPMIFLMPVLQPSRFMRVWGKIARAVEPVTVATYSIELWATFRGFVLCYRRTAETWKVIRWLSSQPPHTTREQLTYQLALSRSLPAYVLPDSPSDSIIVGTFDTVSNTSVASLRHTIRQSSVRSFSGGHMAPIEDAPEVARLVTSVLGGAY